jgi:hypothetical protein
MKYFKEIEIDHYDVVVQKSLDFIKSKPVIYHRLLGVASWFNLDIKEMLIPVPELNFAFSKFNLRPIMVSAYVMYDPKNTSIHTDFYPSQARINIPLLNCAGTYTRFFTNVKTEKWINPDSGIPSFRAINDDYCLAAEVEMKQATVLRTSTPHTVYMPKDNPVPRITLTIGFDKDPVFLLEK